MELYPSNFQGFCVAVWKEGELAGKNEGMGYLRIQMAKPFGVYVLRSTLNLFFHCGVCAVLQSSPCDFNQKDVYV